LCLPEYYCNMFWMFSCSSPQEANCGNLLRGSAVIVVNDPVSMKHLWTTTTLYARARKVS
jgi:hypothetical protein